MKSVLFIRRDNIGDLVCTTPAIRAVRDKYPQARVSVLVNSYNAGAILNNPDVDDVFIYEKGKHRGDKSGIRVAFGNLMVLRRLRAARFEASIGCSYGYSARLARFVSLTGAHLRVGYAPSGVGAKRHPYNRPVEEPEGPVHEVEAMMRLVRAIGADAEAPRLVLRPFDEDVKNTGDYLRKTGLKQGPLVLFVISSRRPENRWPREKFKELGDMIQERHGAQVLLLWAPGRADNPMHPGDDDGAEWLLANMKTRPLAYRTESLNELIAVMSHGSMAVCCDGGAMHIAAALGKPIVTIWGATDRRRWAPWGVPHVILQRGGSADSVSSAEAYSAFTGLFRDTVKA